MSDGELQKQIEKKAFLVAQEPYGKIESGFKEVKLKDVLEVVVAMKRDFPKERLGYCDIAIPEKGRCWIRPTYKDFQEWFVKWFGEAT